MYRSGKISAGFLFIFYYIMESSPPQTGRLVKKKALDTGRVHLLCLSQHKHEDEEGTWNPCREAAGGASCQEEGVFPLRSDE